MINFSMLLEVDLLQIMNINYALVSNMLGRTLLWVVSPILKKVSMIGYDYPNPICIVNMG